jgi:hypothetical protein
VVLIGFLFIQLRKPEKVLNSLIILTWVAPLSIYILFFVAIKPTHFFLPVVIPLFSAIPEMLRNGEASIRGIIKHKKLQSKYEGIWILFFIFLAYQVGTYWKTDYHLFTKTLFREENNSSIAFFSEFDENCLSRLSTTQDKVDVFRDVRVYFPNKSGFRIQSFFTTTNYEIVNKKKPDILVLWNQRINDYTRDEDLMKSIDPKKFIEINRFFMDAKNNSIDGYQLISQSDSVKIFAHNDFLNKRAGFCANE